MSSASDDAINYVLQREGGLINNKNDPGGITNFGISLHFLKSIGYYVDHDDIITPLDVRNLTREDAIKIYQDNFWNPAYDQITNHRLSIYLFDMAVNTSPLIAHKVFQRSTWAWNQKINYIKDDGIFGEDSIKAANAYGLMLMPSFRAERAGYYRTISRINPKLSQFLTGWLNRTYGY